MMPRVCLLFAACLVPSVCVAQSPATTAPPALPPVYPTQGPLANKIPAIVTAPAVSRAHWGVAVTAMDGTPLYGFNEGQFFRPASNAKLFTTAAAMHLLGPEVRTTTGLEGALGTLRGEATINGDLLLVGVGDANISDRVLPYESPSERNQQAVAAKAAGIAFADPNPFRYLQELADKLSAEGIKRVKGDVIGDDTVWPSEPYPSDWTIDDAVWGYGAPISALSILDNQLEVRVSPARTTGGKASVEIRPSAPVYYTIDQSALLTGTAKSGSHVDIDRAPGSHTLRVYGTIAVDSAPDVEEVAIQDPAEYAAMAMREVLLSDGIKVDGHARAKHSAYAGTEGFQTQVQEPLPKMGSEAMPAYVSKWVTGQQTCFDACPTRVEHVSAVLHEDITLTLKVSQNLHAELLLRRLGEQFGQAGTAAQGARVVHQFLLNAGVTGDDVILYDGSGLSGHDLVTPRATAKLLSYASTQPWFAQWKASLPTGGEDGTLRARFGEKSGLKDHVFAKTGTLGESRALSGYVDAASGKTVIFSVFVDTHTPASSADREAMDAIVAAIAAEE